MSIQPESPARQVQNLPLAAALLLVAGLGTFIAYRELASPVAGCAAGSQHMQRVELLFGMGRKDGSEISEAEWRAFLEAEVTPRFPDGLTVLTGYGQWRNPTGAIIKETSRLLLILARPAPGNAVSIEAIRTAWKARSTQDSVMQVDGTSCVSF